MSAIHTGSIAVVTINGRAYFFGENHDHAVTGWDSPETDTAIRIPAQRAGNAYEQVVLNPGDDLADLSDFAEIPQLGKFVRDLIRAEQNETEARS